MSFSLPNLPYAYDALEPYFDKQTMEIHHTKHHQTYVTNLNNAIQGTKYAEQSLTALLSQAGAISPAVRNNAGGHYNHCLFWEILQPSTQKSEPKGKLLEAILEYFGSVDALKEKMNTAGLTRFGSGWAWLVVKEDHRLEVCSTPNQDNPLMDVAEVKGKPIMGIDVWEHAYYLRYQNKRADYLNAFWSVVNWDVVASKM